MSDLQAVLAAASVNADTPAQKISAATVNRVMACFFDVVVGLPADQAHSVISKALEAAGKRCRKKMGKACCKK